MKAIAALLIIQIAGLLVILFGDVGFDKPGKFGLDFRHILFIAAAEAIALILIGRISIKLKRWGPISASFSIIAVGLILVSTIQ